MRTRILILALAALAFALPSCAVGGKKQVKQHPDGTIETTTLAYGQTAGVGGFVATPDGALAIQFDGQKSWRDLMVMTGVVLPASFAAKTEQVAATTAAATEQTAIKSAARVQETTVRTMGSTATSLGNNPEANVGAVDAVGRLFRR